MLGLDRKPKGTLVGRVMTEAMPNGATPKGYTGTVSGKPAANGLQTVLKFQRVLDQRYFDVAGFPGRTVGLPETTKRQAQDSACRYLSCEALHTEIEDVRQRMSERQGRRANQVATSRISVRLLRRVPRIWLAIHSSTSILTPTAVVGAQLSIEVSGDSATERGGTGRPDAAAA